MLPPPPIPGICPPPIIACICGGIYIPAGIPFMPMAGVMFGGMIPVFSDGVGGIVERVLIGGSISCGTCPGWSAWFITAFKEGSLC